MTIPHNIRAVARQTYRHFLFTAHKSQTIGGYAADISDDCQTVSVSGDNGQSWIVPVAKAWL